MEEKNKNDKIRVLYVGNFKISHVRGRVLYKGLLKNDVKVQLSLANNFIEYLKICYKIIKKDYDVLLVTGKPVWIITYLLKFWHRKRIIFDVFISDYENLVINRKTIKNKLFGKLIWLLDKYSCVLSDKVILDTKFHIDYFVNTYGIKKDKFREVFVGADEDFFYPRTRGTKKRGFKVTFYGSFIPGHGIDIMLKAAKLLEKETIFFEFIGFGPLHKEMIELSQNLRNTNVKFLGWIDFKELPKILTKYDVCLGLFDNSVPKVKRVIPTKVFEILAMKKLVITGMNVTMDNYFINKKDLILCKMGSPESLAKEIKWVYNNPKEAINISKKGYYIFKSKFSSVKIGEYLKEIIIDELNSF